MKKSEIQKRLLEVKAHWTDPVDWPLKVAAALGVEIEPDEPELPDTICLVSTTVDILLGSREYSALMNAGGRRITLRSQDRESVERLSRALVDAYNNRPRWRKGEPKEPGLYVRRGTGFRNSLQFVFVPNDGTYKWDDAEWVRLPD